MNYNRSGGISDWPPVVKNIIIINVLTVLAQFVLIQQNIDLQDYLALHYWQSPDFRWWQVITHIFMHGSPNDVGLTVSHIFFNMFGLFMFGSVLERLWGPKRFVLFYLVCGVGAAICQSLVYTWEIGSFQNAVNHFQQQPDFVQYAQIVKNQSVLSKIPEFTQLLTQWSADSHNPQFAGVAVSLLHQVTSLLMNTSMVGASGAIFGILFAFAYLFPNTELFIMFIPIPVKAKWAVAGYAVIELFSGFGRFSGDNVAHFAHLGGMLFAFILLRIWHKHNRNQFY